MEGALNKALANAERNKLKPEIREKIGKNKVSSPLETSVVLHLLHSFRVKFFSAAEGVFVQEGQGW